MDKLTETMGFQKLAETVSVKDGPAWAIREQLERGYFDLNESEIVDACNSIGEAQWENVLANVKRIPFREFFNYKSGKIKEFLASSGTTGIAGAYYLIPVKLYTQLQTEAVFSDIVAQISKVMLGPEDCPGTTLKVDIMKDGQYVVNPTTSGAIAATETMETVQATLDFSTTYGMNIRLANDLIEDNQFGLLELHVNEAGRQIGEKASDLALTALDAAGEGDGTRNTTAGPADATTLQSGGATDIDDAIAENATDGYISDTLVIAPHAWMHSCWKDMLNYSSGTADSLMVNPWPSKLMGLNIHYGDYPITYAHETPAGTHNNLQCWVFAKQYACLSGRKRWMRVEQYSEPVKDLKGAMITFRQDTICIYKDACDTYTEA